MQKVFFSVSFWAKVFLVGMIFHFFLQTFITFGVWLEFTILRLWKEILILLLAFFLAYQFKLYLQDIVKDKIILFLELTFITWVVLTFIINFFVLWTSLSDYVMAFRYDFLWFVIFFLFYHLWNFLEDQQIENILFFFWKTIKVLLVIAFFWYMLIMVKPWALWPLGYDNKIFEWEVWKAPPAVYYTQQNQGFPRNQVLFERPINYWFFLVFFFPMFYVLFLRRRAVSKTWLWWVLYVFSIISTFSRAAWWAWFFQLLVILLLEYGRNIRKKLVYLVLPILLVFSVFVYVGYDQVVQRQWSDTWHFQKVQESWQMFTQAPVLWSQAGYVWPVSHRWDWIEFNPENQFLLILVQYWIVWFIFWFVIYLFLCLIGFYYYFYKFDKKQRKDFWPWLLLAMSLGMVWLSIEWMVLHGFVDRMVVYPSMTIFGLVYFFVHKNYKSLQSKKNSKK